MADTVMPTCLHHVQRSTLNAASAPKSVTGIQFVRLRNNLSNPDRLQLSQHSPSVPVTPIPEFRVIYSCSLSLDPQAEDFFS
ncbi:MAG: hypothetical protein GY696_11685 [Gammaproteobacteria bacterium]|nr:hypothetical protein [Gammaproteobacteria bacterium]